VEGPKADVANIQAETKVAVSPEAALLRADFGYPPYKGLRPLEVEVGESAWAPAVGLQLGSCCSLSRADRKVPKGAGPGLGLRGENGKKQQDAGKENTRHL
jgi:hypothetical protein